MRKLIARFVLQEDINFLLTNRVPRQLLTRFMGWFSKIEQPLVRDLSIATWQLFADLDLSDARQTKFRSLHDCFTRQLRDGARPLDHDPKILISPCDGIVGTCGAIVGTKVIQAKGFPYTLLDLLGDPALVEYYRDGSYVTLRLTSSMYHRFHAPHDCRVEKVTYISGDTWNVNPIALRRVEKLFCKNERALIVTVLAAGNQRITLVPVAAIIVASIRLHFIDVLLHLRYRGPNVIACQANFAKGEEMGWFQHGSTIIVFAPKGVTLRDGVIESKAIRMGQSLFDLPH
ncbi:archaetidylserine decarboxylase [Propionivibrio sp.]|uniref:archaetidylserine decarboxylase n=1 Tax=Propionivibrio sp. TaxID=2212460 RepID=UPI003BEF77A8